MVEGSELKVGGGGGAFGLSGSKSSMLFMRFSGLGLKIYEQSG